MPWFPWYPDDFAGSVRGWSTLQRGGYRDALDAQWTLDGLPADPQEIRKAIGATPAEFRQIWPKIAPKFPIGEDNRRRNPRLERERMQWTRRSEVRSQLGRLGAEKRWGARGNSHPQPMAIAIGDGVPTGSNSHPLANGKPMASTSTSTSIEDPDSGGASSRRRARPASPTGPLARPDCHPGTDESDPEVRRRRAQAAALAASAAPRESIDEEPK